MTGDPGTGREVDEGGRLRINYFLSRSSRKGEMSTAMPERGEARIVLREEAEVLVRVPGWPRAEDLSWTVDGKKPEAPPPLDGTGRYVVPGRLPAGAAIEVRFHITERVTEESIAGSSYRLTWRGNYVVGMEPPGQEFPLYP
jgi:hypothetical protein